MRSLTLFKKGLSRRRTTEPRPTTETEKSEPSSASTSSSATAAAAAAVAATGNYDLLLKGIGSYAFERTLGHGKFSRVMLATHRITGQQVAIKIIDKHAHDYRVMSRLVREITLMECLDHPNIVKLFETFETCDSLFLVMEYVPGCNLDEYLQKKKGGALDEMEARRLFRQIVSAVSYCHHRWVVHRDLKTPNILVTADGVVKLADFGLGNRFGLQRLRTICGSMLYYSPEIISGQKYYGPEVDCWCLGIALFRMTAGYEPFAHAHTVGELKKDVCNGNFRMPSTLSPALQQTIRKCLQVDRRKRMTVRQALKDDPWLTQDESCPIASIPKTVYDDIVLGEHQPRSDGNSEEDRRARQQVMKVMQEPLDTVRRTLVYHPINESTYFTTTARKQSVEALRSRLLQTIRLKLQRIKLRSADRWIQIKQPFSIVKLSEAVQRYKDQTFWFYLGNHRSTDPMPSSQTDPVSPLPSLSSSPSTTSSLSLPPASFPDMQRHQQDLALLDILKQVCQLMGIAYTQISATRLECVLTLRDAPKTQPSRTRANTDHGGGTSAGVSRSNSSQSNATTLTRLTEDDRSTSKRLSLPLISHLTSSMTTSFFGRSKRRQSQDEKKQRQQRTPTPRKKDGVALFSVEIEHKRPTSHGSLITLRFSKQQGSTAVFKMASGWITGVLAVDAQ